MIVWGAHLGQMHVSGVWSRDLTLKHSHKLHRNDGSVLAIQHFQNVLKGQKVLIKTDKTTVMTNINKQRWTHSPYLCILLVGYHQQ